MANRCPRLTFESVIGSGLTMACHSKINIIRDVIHLRRNSYVMPVLDCATAGRSLVAYGIMRNSTI
ncbi:hypothetical protein AAKU61_004475 [Undibacterium sp. GrIS 1.2]